MVDDLKSYRTDMARTQQVKRLMMDADGSVLALQCEQKCPLALIIEPGGHLMTVKNLSCYRFCI